MPRRRRPLAHGSHQLRRPMPSLEGRERQCPGFWRPALISIKASPPRRASMASRQATEERHANRHSRRDRRRLHDLRAGARLGGLHHGPQGHGSVEPCAVANGRLRPGPSRRSFRWPTPPPMSVSAGTHRQVSRR